MDAGRETKLGEGAALGFRLFLAESKEKAIEKARPYFEEAMKFAAPLGLMAFSQEQIDSVAAGGRNRGVKLPTLEEAVEGGGWICGTPEVAVEALKKAEESYPGVERVNIGSVMGMPLEVYKEQLSIFAEEVMPAFKG